MPTQVSFKVSNLYGLSESGVKMPTSATDSIDSGQICLSIDPDAEEAGNKGIVDFSRKKLGIRYDAILVFPGLYDLVTSKNYQPELLNPVRVTATDECVLIPDMSGWRAKGCLEFLPGSVWSSASGG